MKSKRITKQVNSEGCISTTVQNVHMMYGDTEATQKLRTIEKQLNVRGERCSTTSAMLKGKIWMWRDQEMIWKMSNKLTIRRNKLNNLFCGGNKRAF